MTDPKLARSLLEFLLEEPSNLGVRELAPLQAAGWKLIAEECEDIAKIEAIAIPLASGIKKKQGRRYGSNSKHQDETDELVLAKIATGTPKKTAIRLFYSHGLDGHLKRIKRRLKEREMLTRWSKTQDGTGGH